MSVVPWFDITKFISKAKNRQSSQSVKYCIIYGSHVTSIGYITTALKKNTSIWASLNDMWHWAVEPFLILCLENEVWNDSSEEIRIDKVEKDINISERNAIRPSIYFVAYP